MVPGGEACGSRRGGTQGMPRGTWGSARGTGSFRSMAERTLDRAGGRVVLTCRQEDGKQGRGQENDR